MEGVARLAIWDVLEHSDKAATLAINALHTPFTDFIWTVFSNREIWYVLYLAVAAFLFWRLGWKKALVVILACVLTVVVCDQLGNVSKDFFRRLRPCWDPSVMGHLHQLEGSGDKFGFYSAHAANALGFAVCSGLGYRNDLKHTHKLYFAVIVVWAILVGVSRIFVGKHFLGDVSVGFFVGFTFGWLFAKLASLAIVKFRL